MANKKTKQNSTDKTQQTTQKNIIIYDERFRFLVGMFLLFFALFLVLAFVSYFFTWKADQSFEWGNVVSSAEVQVENWTGKTGARFANMFINKMFGIASFAFPFLLVIVGLRLMNIRLLPLVRSLKIVLIGTLVTSIVLGYIFSNLDGYLGSGLGGHYGYVISSWLNAFIGKVGTGFLLTTVVLAFLFFSFPASYEWMKKSVFALLGWEPAETSAESTEEENAPDPATVKASEENPEEASADSPFNPEDTDLIFETEKNEEEPQQADYHVPEGMEEDEARQASGREETSKAEVSNSPETENESEEDVELTVEGQKAEETGDIASSESLENYDPTLELSHFKLPPLDLLEKHEDQNTDVSDEELISNKNKIVETFANFKIQINKIKATIGPTITLYEIVPAPGIKISKIKNLEDDIALSLAALGIRIIAPIPGKGTVGIEVPNQRPQVVSMRSILNSRKFQESKCELSVAIGKTISNETFVFDLTKMPHLLVAGATGQGKSVGLNAIIASLLYKNHPAQLKFVMIDPKKVELSVYSKLEKHYLAKLPDSEESIVTDTDKVVNVLNSLTVEMDDRYNLLKKARVRNITEYNDKFIARQLNPENGHRYMPYIVMIVDEYADLLMTAGKEIESPLARLAQKARAIGIHLIVATQRPTTNIITGVIKANFPARMAFKVSSVVDSRTILDANGANQLIGRGDMLVTSGNELVRVQSAFIDISEIEKVTDFIGEQQGYDSAMILPEYQSEEDEDKEEVDLAKRDGMFEEAARLVVQHQQGSTSLIQRKFSIGYNRAGRIVDQLEAAGVVGPFEGSKARKVLIADEYTLEQHLDTLQ